MFPYVAILGRTISSYGLFLALGCGAAFFLALYRTRQSGLDGDHLLIIGAIALGGGLVGSKLLYLLVTYSLGELMELICTGNFSVLLGGGLVFYGGLLGGLLGAFLGARIAGAKLTDYERAVVPAIPLGHAFGRLGCLAAGCCYGMAYTGPCAIRYPVELPGLPYGETVFPVQPLESAVNLVVCGVLLLFSRRQRRKFDLLLLYLILYAVERFSLEFLRGDVVRGIRGGLSSSQWVSLGILAGCGAVCVVRHLKGARRAKS